MTQTTERKVDAGLREGVMSGPELAAQAIASIAPSAVIAFTAASIFLGAGNGTMMAFALATIVILCVGYIVTVFARRHASAGSLYTYVSKGLGPSGAFAAGVALLIGSWGIAAGSLGGAVSYASDLLQLFGVPATGTVWLIVLTVLIGGLATFFTIRGIRISARVSLVLELVSVFIIVVLLVAALAWLGPDAWDPAQFSFEGVPFQGVAAGMVLGILGFVGFSSADALGREARNPHTAIPRAIMWSAVVVGVLYVFAAYTQIAVLGDELGEVASPLQAINDRIGMPVWFAPVLVFGVAASFFAVVVAPLNVVGRIV
ncbi:APC family permease [Leucobacter muris]